MIGITTTPCFVRLTAIGTLPVIGLIPGIALGQWPPPPEQSPEPHWIWCRDTGANASPSPAASEACRLERTFQLERPVQSATLRLAADFCHLQVEINGRGVVSV